MKIIIIALILIYPTTQFLGSSSCSQFIGSDRMFIFDVSEWVRYQCGRSSIFNMDDIFYIYVPVFNVTYILLHTSLSHTVLHMTLSGVVGKTCKVDSVTSALTEQFLFL